MRCDTEFNQFLPKDIWVFLSFLSQNQGCLVLACPGPGSRGIHTFRDLYAPQMGCPRLPSPVGSELPRVSCLQVEHDPTHGERLLLAHQE